MDVWDRPARPGRRTGILVVDTTESMTPPQRLHAALVRLLDRARFRPYVAAHARATHLNEWNAALGAWPWTLPLGQSVFSTRGIARRARVAASNTELLGSAFRLAAMVRSNAIEIIHTETNPRDVLIATAASWLTGARLVLHWHVTPWGHSSLIWRAGWLRARAIVAVSDATRRALIAAGAPAQEITVIHNGVDLERFRIRPDARVLRSRMGLPIDAVVVLLAGRVCPWKGQDELISAMSMLVSRRIPVVALIVGDEDPWARAGGGYREELRAKVASLGLDSRLSFHDRRSDMADLIAVADIIAVPSHDDPFPTVVLEAMATGRAIVGADSGGIPEQLVNGRTGLLTETGSHVALADAIARLALDPGLRQRLGAAARHEAELRFDERRMANDFAALYERVATHGGVRVAAAVESGSDT